MRNSEQKEKDMEKKLNRPADRVLNLPPYIFSEIDNKKNALRAQGADLIDFGVGDPDMETPAAVVKELLEQAPKNENQKYPAYNGAAFFREAAGDYMRRRFSVTLNPENQVTALLGTKEGLAHFSWAFLQPGDIALVPDPAFPVYANSARFAGAEVVRMPLLEENSFFPDVYSLPEEVVKKSKVIFLNYPNNPMGTVADRDRLSALIRWALKNSISIVYDAAYAEIVYDPEDRFSILELEGANDCAIEFHSFSKTFNMTGWRLGFACGNRDLVNGLVKLKTNIDSGVFDAIQYAGVKALENAERLASDQVAFYRQRRDALLAVFQRAGIGYVLPRGAFYVMARTPEGMNSMEFSAMLLEKAGIVTTPGAGFGEGADKFVRFALTKPLGEIRKAASRLAALNL